MSQSAIGVVAIGRNEGERLKNCLNSLSEYPVVYVDSGSSDDSVTFAKSRGVICVELDMNVPFTAARARNAGFEALIRQNPNVKYVMFVDGDCVVEEAWWPAALAAIEQRTEVSTVCGRRKERYPKASVYNLLCDIEWDTPVGTARSCGGDALYKVEAFQNVGGFDELFIAGEEPELCFRLRNAGYQIERIDAPMTLHDAAITRFGQWWKRSVRSGYAYWLNFWKHGEETEERFCAKEVRSIAVWTGLMLGALMLSVAFRTSWPLVVFLALAGLQYLKMFHSMSRVRNSFGHGAAARYAFFVLLGKVPQSLGVVRGLYKSLFAKTHTLVEYK